MWILLGIALFIGLLLLLSMFATDSRPYESEPQRPWMPRGGFTG
jgi:hypothetical protein